MSHEFMQIGEVAERTHLSLRTIRHYEAVGLVVPSARSKGGFRLYTEDDVQRLYLVRRMKPLDLTLEEVRELLNLLDSLDDPAGTSLSRDVVIDRISMYREAALSRAEALREETKTVCRLAADLAERIGAADETAAVSSRRDSGKDAGS